MSNDAIIGTCLECDQFIYEDDPYEGVGDTVSHAECLQKCLQEEEPE